MTSPGRSTALITGDRLISWRNGASDGNDGPIIGGDGSHLLPKRKAKSLAKAKIDDPAVETPASKRNRLLVEGKLAMAEYAARAAAIDKNTQRLRALRLAKEAADRETASLNPAPEKPKRKRASRK